jgi:hypothetical protein
MAVDLPDGTTDTHYVELPADADVWASLRPSRRPHEHLGQPITSTDAPTLAGLYLGDLRRMVEDAIERSVAIDARTMTSAERTGDAVCASKATN